MTRFGVDVAFTPRPSPADYRRHGVTFVARYLAGGKGGSKELTRSEAVSLSKAGLDLVVVWETTAGRAGGGGRYGAPDARTAGAQAKTVGMPGSRPIFFAVDFDAEGAQVERYFRAVGNVLGVKRVGCYGSYRVVKHLFDKKLISYGWETYAWSNGSWDHRAQLQQYSNGHSLAGCDVDYDRAVARDFGQWRVGSATVPRPPKSDTKLHVDQELMNGFVKGFKLPHGVIPADGLPGPLTDALVVYCKRCLGYIGRSLTPTIDATFIRRIRRPYLRTFFYPAMFTRGVKFRQAQRRGHDVSTVQGCARYLLTAPTVRFWDGLSTGSDRVKFDQLARTGSAYCNHRNRTCRVRLNLLQFLVACARSGPITITCLNGGDHPYEDAHPNDWRHYADPCKAVDVARDARTAERERIAHAHGGWRLAEADHDHFQFD